jgi:hypothetical protein
VINAANQAGVLAKIADQLAKAKINIEYAYMATGANLTEGLIVLRTSDSEKTKKALQDL